MAIHVEHGNAPRTAAPAPVRAPLGVPAAAQARTEMLWCTRNSCRWPTGSSRCTAIRTTAAARWSRTSTARRCSTSGPATPIVTAGGTATPCRCRSPRQGRREHRHAPSGRARHRRLRHPRRRLMARIRGRRQGRDHDPGRPDPSRGPAQGPRTGARTDRAARLRDRRRGPRRRGARSAAAPRARVPRGHLRWLVAETLARATGRPFTELVREEIAEPLGMPEFWYQVPQAQRGRIAKLFPHINPAAWTGA